MSKIAISGASGLIGGALAAELTRRGHSVVKLVRQRPVGPGQLYWSPTAGEIDAAGLEGLDSVVHLAGENIGGQRWTPAFKQKVLQSRVQGTRLLAHTFARLTKPPSVFVSASAVGYYGDSGDAIVDERSGPGSGFLSDVCVAWEEASQPAAAAGLRLVNARIGVVLSPQGGMLAKLLPLFKLGLGGRVGDGRQWLSWIALEDVVAALIFCAENAAVRGPVNLTAPQPVSNEGFTKTLAKTLGRPAFAHVPKFAVKAAMGSEMSEMALGSTRAIPQALNDLGFAFSKPMLASALAQLKR